MKFARWPVLGLPGCELVVNRRRPGDVPPGWERRTLPPTAFAPDGEWFVAINDAGGDWSDWVEKSGAPLEPQQGDLLLLERRRGR
jgi:hypothetical protein